MNSFKGVDEIISHHASPLRRDIIITACKENKFIQQSSVEQIA
jgi:hypothetical protein